MGGNFETKFLILFSDSHSNLTYKYYVFVFVFYEVFPRSDDFGSTCIELLIYISRASYLTQREFLRPRRPYFYPFSGLAITFSSPNSLPNSLSSDVISIDIKDYYWRRAERVLRQKRSIILKCLRFVL